MTIHMFRCYIGIGSMTTNDLETAINDWVHSNAEWEDDTEPHQLREGNTSVDGNGEDFYTMSVRFLPDNSKDNLFQKFEDKLVNKVNWYRVGYHNCTHRDGDGHSGACSWEDAREWTDKDVSIPSEIPTFI